MEKVLQIVLALEKSLKYKPKNLINVDRPAFKKYLCGVLSFEENTVCRVQPYSGGKNRMRGISPPCFCGALLFLPRHKTNELARNFFFGAGRGKSNLSGGIKMWGCVCLWKTEPCFWHPPHGSVLSPALNSLLPFSLPTPWAPSPSPPCPPSSPPATFARPPPGTGNCYRLILIFGVLVKTPLPAAINLPLLIMPGLLFGTLGKAQWAEWQWDGDKSPKASAWQGREFQSRGLLLEAHKRFILAPWLDIQHREKYPARAVGFWRAGPSAFLSLF